MWRGDEVDLDKLPLIKCWPEDGGTVHHASRWSSRATRSAAFATSGCIACMQTGQDTLAMHWQRHKVGAAHWREMAERGEKMPVCIALGADPAVDVLGERAASADDRRVHVRRISAEATRVARRKRSRATSRCRPKPTS